MNIIVNDETFSLENDVSLTDLLMQLKCHQPGTALAINQTIVPHVRWPDTRLQEGDELVIFQAIAGG